MTKYLYINKDNVIIDIVDIPKYVRRNKNNLTILCSPDQAQGVIGSDNETIYALQGKQLIPSYSDITSVVCVDVSELVVPLKFKYEAGEIVANKEAYPVGNIELSIRSEKNAADIEYLAMMADIKL